MVALGFFFVMGCGSENFSETVLEKEGEDIVQKPNAVTLVSPENETVCTEGTVINDTENMITFMWDSSENTDSYDLVLLNLDTDQTYIYSSTLDELEVTLLRGTPFEWYVVSKANGTEETAESEKWRFYNEGLGDENHAPFSAEAIFPKRGTTIQAESGLVTLEWSAADADGDIIEYEVFFGTKKNPDSIGTTTSTSMSQLSVASGETYYWKVITRDVVGNSSVSEVFSFNVG